MRLLLLAVPLAVALAGPWFVPVELVHGVSYTDAGLLGTDFAGRDVWHQVLLGGRSLVLTAVLATAGAYLLGTGWGLVAAGAPRMADDALMRPLDVLMSVPSLLLLLVAAALAPGGALGWIVLLIHLPDIARLVRACALEIGTRPAVEAMRLQGESRWRITTGFVVPAMARVLATDAGTRLTGSLYLVAAASFLGVGVPPDAADWAVMVDRNRGGLFLNPWAVLAPALLIVMLAVGLNLTADRALRKAAP
ncbi:transporter integral membrane protein [Planomonospora parontospora subsp. parontospora]|uniref:Transporter integral membrane protein n=2 Tax=Planomonospora parontospora TaxID=58119 RepID=A0AA37F7I6_9ACTN|nr:ABC transporter permease subunit [Planomonospora parontospora]GGK90058.1 transporter integral membrane protein [Planomonospora parontospora]GII11687.1 transporter integral membrane protein [Planomonospora parontospora subsp. parontospora]